VRLRRRLTQLYLGLVLFGVSDGMLLLAGLGVDPWDVFHQGLSRRLGLGVGTWAVIVGALVLLAWIPLRQRPGIGTVSNVVIVGSVIDLMLALVPAPHDLVVRVVIMLLGVALNGVATGAYIGARLGPGPRDGLMTGLAARGHSIRVVRTAIELSVLVVGYRSRTCSSPCWRSRPEGPPSRSSRKPSEASAGSDDLRARRPHR
jgi:uncharacterized membrane protein YczE